MTGSPLDGGGGGGGDIYSKAGFRMEGSMINLESDNGASATRRLKLLSVWGSG